MIRRPRRSPLFPYPPLSRSGIIADRVLGHRRTVIIGALLMALGHFMMAFEPLLLLALLVLIVGNEDEERKQQQRLERHRSEEHTSELPSRQYLVCRLLLYKK